IFSRSVSGATSHALVNISTLARINSPTDSIVSGFVISGSATRTVLVRAVGPTLAAFGVTDALGKPALTVFKENQVVAGNSAWAGVTRESTDSLTNAFDRAGAFRLADESSDDAALVVNLDPGAYTVQVTSRD